jgi:hypothetical protein
MKDGNFVIKPCFLSIFFKINILISQKQHKAEMLQSLPNQRNHRLSRKGVTEITDALLYAENPVAVTVIGDNHGF